MANGRALMQKKRAEMQRAQKHKELARYTNLDSIMGNDWAIFRGLIGGRKTGKSYALADRICRLNARNPGGVKCYWLRISEKSTQALLANKAEKLIDPDLYRKYGLSLTTKAGTVYNHGKSFCGVYPLSAFGKLKGVGFYDKDFTGRYVIVLDEFQLEQGERRTSFDILYNFVGMCENLVRTEKNNVEVWLVGNTLEEASTILKAFNFLPEKFGRFYLRSKRCVIDNMEPTEEYLKDRAGSIADILGGDAMSNYTNDLKRDRELINHERLKRVTSLIKFSKDPADWYTIYDGQTIRKYKNESVSKDLDIAMIPYVDTFYSPERRIMVFDMYDARAFKFDSLITQSYFQDALKRIRTR